jgi:hypothetical protein
VNLLRVARASGGEGNVDFVNGDVLLGRGSYLELCPSISTQPQSNAGSLERAYLACLALALVHRARLHKPQPVAERRVQEEVRDYCGQGVRLRRLPAKLPVVIEECARDDDGSVADG